MLQIAQWVLIVAAGSVAIASISSPHLGGVALLLLAVAIAVGSFDRQRRVRQLHTRLVQLRRQLLEQLQDIQKDLGQMPAPTPTPTPMSAGVVKGQLASVERSLARVVDYLREATFPERVEENSQAIARLWEMVEEMRQHTPRQREGKIGVEPMQSLAKVNEESPSAAKKRKLDLPPMRSRSKSKGSVPVMNWQLKQRLDAHRERVAALAMHPQGNRFASVGWDGELKIWELAGGQQVAAVCDREKFCSVTFLDDDRLATGSFDGMVGLWELDTGYGELVGRQTWRDHDGSVRAVAGLNSSKLFLGGGYDGRIFAWDWERMRREEDWLDDSGAIYALAVCPKEDRFVSGTAAGRVALWEVKSRSPLRVLQGNVASVESLAIAADGSGVAAGCSDGSVKFWSLAVASDLPGRVWRSPALTSSVVFVGDSVAAGSLDGLVRLWHPAAEQPLAMLAHEQDGGVTALTGSDRWLVAGTVGGAIRIWQRQ